MYVPLDSRLLFTKGTDVLPQNLMKSRSREIGCFDDRIALKFDGQIEEQLGMPKPESCSFETRYYSNTSVRLVNRGPDISRYGITFLHVVSTEALYFYTIM